MGFIHSLALATSVVLGLTGAAPAANATGAVPTQLSFDVARAVTIMPGGSSGTGVADFAAARRDFDDVNAARRGAGREELVWDEGLANGAVSWSRNMLISGRFAHDSSGNFGENIVHGPASEIHQLWMDSPGHRSNILNADYTRIGVGVVADPGIEGWVYATERFL